MPHVCHSSWGGVLRFLSLKLGAQRNLSQRNPGFYTICALLLSPPLKMYQYFSYTIWNRGWGMKQLELSRPQYRPFWDPPMQQNWIFETTFTRSSHLVTPIYYKMGNLSYPSCMVKLYIDVRGSLFLIFWTPHKFEIIAAPIPSCRGGYIS